MNYLPVVLSGEYSVLVLYTEAQTQTVFTPHSPSPALNVFPFVFIVLLKSEGRLVQAN